MTFAFLFSEKNHILFHFRGIKGYSKRMNGRRLVEGVKLATKIGAHYLKDFQKKK